MADDGSGDYSYLSMTVDSKTWLPNPLEVFKLATEHMEEKLKDEKGTVLKIIAFNRI